MLAKTIIIAMPAALQDPDDQVASGSKQILQLRVFLHNVFIEATYLLCIELHDTFVSECQDSTTITKCLMVLSDDGDGSLVQRAQ